MARILPNPDISILRINRWLGLNENPDGDTQLRPGEAAEMQNFKITRDGNLQIRPGMRTVHAARPWAQGPINGVWHGTVAGSSVTVFAADGRLWRFDFTTNTAAEVPRQPGVTLHDAPTHFFGFSGKLYIMNGRGYFEWEGGAETVKHVEGYRPLTHVSTPPAGGGTALEQINKLNGHRRVRFSPNGTATEFSLPERNLQSVDFVRNTATGADMAFTRNLANGTVTITPAPVVGVNTIEVGYTVGANFRAQVESMRFSEFFNGGADNRVFIYGDGSNKTFYSGLDSDGMPRADYFPDLNVLDVGSANTPVTALIRHHDRLAIFKTTGAYTARHGIMTMQDGRAIPAFYVSTVNRSIGNAAMGQTQLVGNNPRTLFASAVYEWRSHEFSPNNDERGCRVLSHRVHMTLAAMNLDAAFTFDDNERQEYYIVENGTAVVHSYATDTWFIYRDFNLTHMFTAGGRLYGATTGGDIVSIARAHTSDNGKPISALWRSGSIAFGRDWQRKYVSRLFVTVKPESKGFITAGIRSNRHSGTMTRVIRQGLATFRNANFRHWSFGTSRQPQTRRFRIKANKLTFFQLMFTSNTDWSTATILAAHVRLMYAGDVRD